MELTGIKKILYKNENLIAIIIVAITIVISLITPAFFSLENLFDVLQACIVNGILATAVLLVLISGGIDVSFASIAIFSAYSTITLLNNYDYQGPVIFVYLIACGFGLGLGVINALLISVFRFPTLIVTLGTSNMFQGIMLTFMGTIIISKFPDEMVKFSKLRIFEMTTPSGSAYGFPVLIFVMLGVLLFIWYLLQYTAIGRKIFALGGSRIIAQRMGINIIKTQIFIYCLAGVISAIGGVTHVVSVRMMNPTDLIGTELSVIAAVVIGGARITGGHGSVIGTILGVVLVAMINSSMILLRIPTYYHGIVIGVLIILGVGITAYQTKKTAEGIL